MATMSSTTLLNTFAKRMSREAGFNRVNVFLIRFAHNKNYSCHAHLRKDPSWMPNS